MTHNNRPKVYWFKARDNGYGCGLPCSWQGWVFTIVWLLALILSLFYVLLFDLEQILALLLCFGVTWVMCMVMMIVCYFKGEPAGWR